MNTDTSQWRFDGKYVTSSEICKRLGVSRAAMTAARRRGMLPDPVSLNGTQIYLWEREVVQPYLEAWELTLKARRGQLVE